MKFAYPDIDFVFDTSIGKVNTVVIENQKLFLRLLQDLENQLCGLDGLAVVSDNNKILPTDKKLELLARFVPFELNRKPLLNKISAALEKTAVSGEFYQRSMELLTHIEAFLNDISFEFPINVGFGNIGIGSVIKGAGVEIVDDYEKLGEKIIDYFELVTEFLGRKLFVTVNLRSFISDDEAEDFIKTVLSHEYNVIMIENCEHPLLTDESRHIVDSDLCEIHR